jgi:hypothetical protein
VNFHVPFWTIFVILHGFYRDKHLIEFGQLVLEKKIFKNIQCIFTLLLLSPFKVGHSPSFENKLESPP